ncbi:MAG TPA: hypothetical protein VK306_08380 [Acidimicrobiales bacterium]|nr:hypothetical protein [Acidimicrobiales bacterium]
MAIGAVAAPCDRDVDSPGAIRTVHHIDRLTTPQPARCHERALRTPCAHARFSAQA